MLRRLVIPGALAAIMVGAAIGAAATYLTAPGQTLAPPPDSHTAPSRHGGHASRPVTTTGRPRATRPTNAPSSRTAQPPATSAGPVGGRLLNDQGYALIERGDYRAAIPPLSAAVVDLRGTGPADPYEAYANYNLGYALLQVGDCTGALPPLKIANQLETSPLVDTAIRRASACGNQGS